MDRHKLGDTPEAQTAREVLSSYEENPGNDAYWAVFLAETLRGVLAETGATGSEEERHVMTGPEQYREATLLLMNEAGPCEYGCPHSGCPHEIATLMRAQAHATLAMTYAFNRAQTELSGLLQAMLTDLREHREAISGSTS